jgi:2-polyprenyl-3-methyl-5-hydroxy-6-metoxy-1,4-benzoquinol methylase
MHGQPVSRDPRPPADYYGRARDDLFALVPELPAGSRVLEIGCGEGQLGSRLRARGHEVHGVEVVPSAAAAAARVLDRALCADVERTVLDYPPGHFQLLLCGDVLEHLVDPWGVLARLRQLCAPGAMLVCSVPNAQYFPVSLGLLRGRFDYRDSGVLDRTHLRFFTRRSARALVERAGFAVEAMPAVYPFRSAALRAVARVLDACSLGALRGLLTGQVYLRARARALATAAAPHDGIDDG